MNPATSSPIPIAPPVPRRRRWWRGVLLLLALVVVGSLLFWGISSYMARLDWDNAVAETDRLDPRWRLEDIEADRPVIPDEENSALHIRAVARKGAGINLFMFETQTRVIDKLPGTARLNRRQEELFRSELAKIAKPLAEARKLKDMPRGRFPVTYSDDFFGTLDDSRNSPTLGQDMVSVRNVAAWLSYDTYLLAHDGNGKCDEAVESCLAIIHAARTMDGEPFMVSYLIRIAVDGIALGRLERVLAQGQASEQTLQTIQAALEVESRESQFLTAVRGERAGHHHLFENMRAGKVKLKHSELADLINGPGATKPASLNDWLLEFFPSTMLKNYPDYLRHMNRCVEIAKLPIHERGPKVNELEKDPAKTNNSVIGLMAPDLSRFQIDGRSQAMLRSTFVALACERYRLRHKVWPDSLAELVEKKLLDAIPADPMDGQPIRYRITKDGIVVYSIGLDLTDNHGHIDRERNPSDPGQDIGFRLWDVKTRRQPPVAVPEGD